MPSTPEIKAVAYDKSAGLRERHLPVPEPEAGEVRVRVAFSGINPADWKNRARYAGESVLIAGGAGAVGHAAIQLASWASADVIATVSSDRKAVLARAAGARHIVNYRNENAAETIRDLAPKGIDVIVEVAPQVNAD